MDPSSAPIPEPMRPAQIKAVIIGPISRIIEILTMDGIHDTAPNSRRVGRDCKVNTKPMMNPVTATNNKERFPCKSIDEGILKFKGPPERFSENRPAKRQVRQFRVRKI
jgi:hypothetical protein